MTNKAVAYPCRGGALGAPAPPLPPLAFNAQYAIQAGNMAESARTPVVSSISVKFVWRFGVRCY